MVQVVLVGGNGGTAGSPAPPHQRRGVQQGHGEQPHGGHGHEGPCAGCIVVAAERNEAPGQDEAQQQRSAVPEENPGSVVPGQPCVEQHKAQHGADGEQQNPQHLNLPGLGGKQGHAGGSYHEDAARQAIQAIDHVVGVDHAQCGKNGDWNGEPAQSQYLVTEQAAKIIQAHIGVQDHQQAGADLHQEAQRGREFLAVIGHADDQHQQAAGAQRRQKSGLYEAIGRHDPKEDDCECDEDGQAADYRSG